MAVSSKGLDELRKDLQQYKPGLGVNSPEVVFPKHLYIGLYGKTGCGKSSLINSLKFAAAGTLKRSQLLQFQPQLMGKHTKYKKVHITSEIYVVDNRGIDDLSTDYALEEIAAQLDGKRYYSEVVNWLGNKEEDGDANIAIGCVVLVISLRHGLSDVAGLQKFADVVHKQQGRYPMAVITNIDTDDRSQLELLRTVLQMHGISDIFEVANITAEKQELEDTYQYNLLSLLVRCMVDGDKSYIFKHHQRKARTHMMEMMAKQKQREWKEDRDEEWKQDRDEERKQDGDEEIRNLTLTMEDMMGEKKAEDRYWEVIRKAERQPKGPLVHSDNPQDARSARGDSNTSKSTDSSSSTLAPLEILARGPKAYKAYLDATRDSTKAVFRTRLMLVGQERVGKTSLKKSLTGQRFDPHEGVTNGVEINIEVASTEGAQWSMCKKEDDYNTALADNITERLVANKAQDMSTSELHSEITHRKKSRPGTRVDEYRNAGPAETMKTSDNGTQVTVTSVPQKEEFDENKVKREQTGAASDETTGAPRESQKQGQIPDNIAGLVETMLRKKRLMEAEECGKTDGRACDELSLSIWDFAGQDVYYTTHQVFLTWRAVYILVFDLSRDLDSTVLPEDRGELYTKARRETQSELTCLEFINFWLCSIYAHAVAPSSKTGKNVTETAQKSPKVFIVGTHREDVKGHRRERRERIYSAFRKISNFIKEKPFKHHVVTRYYAIDNSLEDRDEELLALREHIKEVAAAEPYMGEKIPLRWLLFEEAVSASKANYMTLDEAKELVRPVGIESEEELFTMLNFYHDLGTIVYYGDIDDHQSLLRDIVILNPQWLIDVFKQVISIPEFAERDEFVRDDWNSLENRGILTDKLIKHLWHVQKEALTEIMLKFDLICEAPAHWHKPEKLDKSDDEDKDVKKSYYVPSRMTSDCSKRDIGQIKSSQDFYVDFRGFLPSGFFHRLMARAVKGFGEKGGKPATLFYRHISKMMEDHQVVLEMLPSHEAAIKIAIFRNDVDKENGGVLDDDKHPGISVVSEVMDFVKESLTSLKQQWAKRIQYDFYSACPQCGKRKLLEDSSEGISLYCRKHGMSEDVAANDESIQMPSKTVQIDSSGGNIEIEECGIKMEVPPRALKTPVDITLKPLYNPPKLDVSSDEMIASCGFQCSPGGLQFDEQVTVTLTHCAVFSRHVPMQAVLYVCDSDDDGCGVYKKIFLGRDCTVNQQTVDIRIRHFTRHWVYLLALRSLLGQVIPPSKKIYITPFLRTLTTASHYDLKVFFCNADPALLEEIKTSPGNKNYEMVDYQTDFRLRTDDGDVEVKLSTDPPYPSLGRDNNISKTEILRKDSSRRCFDLNFEKMDTNVRVKLFIGQKKVRELNVEQPTYTSTVPIEFVITKSVETTCVPGATSQTLSSDIEEIELLTLAGKVSHTDYQKVCIHIGIPHAEGERVLSKHLMNYETALTEILCKWNKKTKSDKSNREVLAQKLRKANLDSFGIALLAGHYKTKP